MFYILSFIRTGSLCAGIVSLLTFAHAEVRLTEQSAIAIALQKNPELQAARYAIAEAEGRAQSAGRLTNPELELEGGGGRITRWNTSVGITQRFPLTAKLRLERNISMLEIEIARAEIQNQERLLAIRVRSAFYKLVFAGEAIRLGDDQVALATAFADSLSEGVRQGFSSLLDKQQALLTVSLLKTHADSLAVEEVTAMAELNQLLGNSAETSLAIKSTMEFPISVPPVRRLHRRPDLTMASLFIQSGATEIALAKANRWEDIGVGTFLEIEKDRDEPSGALAGVRLSIPLPVWQNGSGSVAEKQAIHAKRAQLLKALHLEAENQVTSAYRVLTIHHQTTSALRGDLRTFAKQNLHETETAYRRGEVSVEDVFQAHKRLAEIETSELEARKNYFLSYAEWLGALGFNQ